MRRIHIAFACALALLLVATLIPRAEGPAPDSVALDVLSPPEVLTTEVAPLNTLAHRDSALAHVGVREIGYNRGAAVERYQAAAGIPPGSPWCAAAVSYWLQAAERGTETEIVSPASRGGVATSYIETGSRLTGSRSIDARDVQFSRAEPESGMVAVWRLGDSWRGHNGIVDEWDGTCGYVVEGNTSGAAATSEQTRDGDGVYRTRRCVGQGGSLRLVAFTPVIYAS